MKQRYHRYFLVLVGLNTTQMYMLYMYSRMYWSHYCWQQNAHRSGNRSKFKRSTYCYFKVISKFDILEVFSMNRHLVEQIKHPDYFLPHGIPTANPDYCPDSYDRNKSRKSSQMVVNVMIERATTFFLLHWDYEPWIILPAYLLSSGRGKQMLLSRTSKIHLYYFFSVK